MATFGTCCLSIRRSYITTLGLSHSLYVEDIQQGRRNRLRTADDGPIGAMAEVQISAATP